MESIIAPYRACSLLGWGRATRLRLWVSDSYSTIASNGKKLVTGKAVV